jgi:hypothetical protein
MELTTETKVNCRKSASVELKAEASKNKIEKTLEARRARVEKGGGNPPKTK